jgi:hypothetical protein
MRTTVSVVTLVAVTVSALGLVHPRAAAASSWTTTLAAGSKGEAASGSIPAAPTGVAGTCQASNQQIIKVTWTAAAHATSYSVSKASTSGGTYTTVATGVAGTSWTSGTLATGNYWFKVTAYIGTNWVGALSNASPTQRTISSGACA